MPKETIDKKPVSFPEVVTIFNKRKKAGELNYLQRIALEHAQRSSKINSKHASRVYSTEEVEKMLDLLRE